MRRVLALANKYAIEHLRRRIILHLEQDWPTTIWQWDRMENEIHGIIGTWSNTQQPLPFSENLDDHLPEPASAIRLARDCDVPSILPAAFYQLSRLSVCHDRLDTHNNSNRIAVPSCESRFNSRRTADWSVLTSEDFICLLRGQVNLAMASQDLLTSHWESVYRHTDDQCSTSQQYALMMKIREKCAHSHDILYTLRQILEQKSFGDSICSACTVRIEGELGRFRAAIWSKLPEYFHLV